ncbi:MAG: NAD(P)-dependent alcohol dehydrogenase [Polyangiaceae bacterium]
MTQLVDATSAMWAAVVPRYGGPEVVEVVRCPVPVPRRGEIRLRVLATTVSAADHRLRSLDVPAGFGWLVRLAFGLTRPRKRVLGAEVAGVVDAVGPGVEAFREGDRVFALAGAQLGGHAERCILRAEGAVAPIPDGLAVEEAAALAFGGTAALHFLRTRAQLRRGERVLVNGATGAVGSAAVQLATHFGGEVTAVCSAEKAEVARALGAVEVLDYREVDFAELDRRWDVVVDTVGNCSYARCHRVLAAGGRLALVAATLWQNLGALVPRSEGRRVLAGVAAERRDDLELLAELAVAGAYRPLVGRTFPLARIADAHAHVSGGHKLGNVVVTL